MRTPTWHTVAMNDSKREVPMAENASVNVWLLAVNMQVDESISLVDIIDLMDQAGYPPSQGET